MKSYPIKITQVFRVEKSIVIERQANSLEDAIDEQEGDDAPSASDPRWKTRTELENESVDPA